MSNLVETKYFRGANEIREGLAQNLAVFRGLINQIHSLSLANNPDAAVAFAQIAADYAWKNPIGQLASPELEQLVKDIGEQFLPVKAQKAETTPPGLPRRVLHVLTAAYPIGGHTRFVWRWIQQDSQRTHSLVLTRQCGAKVPTQLMQAVEFAKGQIHFLDHLRGGLLRRAQELRELACGADMVVLHVHPCDVLPILAFAQNQIRPPVIYVNHADHVFSIGLATSDIVANIRTSGYLTANRRRGIPEVRESILPIPLGKTLRTHSRTEAKSKLGFPKESIVLLSIADATKYKAIGEVNFRSAVLPVLERYDSVCLALVGPKLDEDWEDAVNRFPGRIKLLGRQEGTSLFYEAADIYLDSFPFASLTSLLEAGRLGTPLATFFPYPEAANVLGADDIALQNCMLKATTLEDYWQKLGELIESPAIRSELGKSTEEFVMEDHCGEGWIRHLEPLYQKAANAQASSENSLKREFGVTNELDELLLRLHISAGIACSLDKIFRSHLGLLPLWMKIEKWRESKGLAKVLFARAVSSEWAFARTRHWLRTVVSG